MMYANKGKYRKRDTMGKFTGMMDKLKMLSTIRKVVTALVAATGLAIGGGAVVVSSVGNNNNTPIDTDFSEPTEIIGYIEETETAEVATTEEASEIIEDITITIKTSSIFEDLKVKIVNEKGNLVGGFPFEIVVTPINGEEGDDRTVINFSDHDMDGILYLKEMKGGDYVIDLKELEGIIISKNSVKATVKGELEYEKVDNEDEIKKDDASEDTAQNNVVVEAVLQDTLPLLPSSDPIPVEVAKDKVDFSNFPAASVSKEVAETTLQKIEKVDAQEVSILSVERYTLMSSALLGEETTASSTHDAIDKVASQKMRTGEPPVEGTPQPQTEESSSVEAESPTDTQAPTDPQPTQPTSTEAPSSQPASTDPQPSTDASSNPSSEQGSSSEGGNSTDKPSEGGSSSDGSTDKTEGDSEPDTEKPSQDEPVASATVKLPKSVQLYHYGNNNSKTAKITLEISDEKGIIVADSIKWSISDKNIADMTVAEDKKTATLVAKKAGTAAVVVEVKYVSDVDGTIATSQISCTVDVGNHTDNTTHLKDVNKQPLYINGAGTKIATPANYATATKLYTTPKYTGWQTINGKLYYFKADNTPATGGQVIGGVQYNFNSDGWLIPSAETYGIDVSKWQGNIDWKAVSQSGVKFAIIRCAYRGAKDGQIHEDPYFKANIKGATQNGIKVGVYFFTQAVNEVEAIEEASMSIALVQGYHLNFPIFIDTEKATNGRANGLDKATRTRVVKAFCETVRNSGYKPGIYASKSWYNDNLDMSQLSAYNIWVAQYNTSCNYTGRYDMWQYTDSGSVPGIKGNVDMNKCYTNY